MAKSGKAVGRPAKAAGPKSQVMQNVLSDDPNLNQIFRVTDKISEEDIIRYAELPGVELEFDAIHFHKLDDGFVAMLPASAQKAYWTANAEFEGRRKLANQALYETPTAVDPMAKLLDGPHGTANPLVRDSDEIKKLLPGYYITWRIEGGQGDLDNALRAGFQVIRHPKDNEERKTKSPLDWSGERWKVRDGTVDPTSGDEIFNVMVAIREKAWKENLEAMSMISHNAYATNKQQFVEGVSNISRDMLSAKERVQVVSLDEMRHSNPDGTLRIADLDELKVEEHTEVRNGKRVIVNP
jgi:hypothetical protein